jgi:hypothetical protein
MTNLDHSSGDSTPTFGAAAALELKALGRRRLSAKTQKNYADELGALGKFFSSRRLGAISAHDIGEYQKFRRAAAAGPIQINHEVNKLARILDRAGLWDPLKPAGRWGEPTNGERYRPLQPPDPAKAKAQKRASYARTSPKLNRRRRNARQKARRESEALLRTLSLVESGRSKITAAEIREKGIELEMQMLKWDAPPSKKRAEALDRLVAALRKQGFQPSDVAPLARLSRKIAERAERRGPAKAARMKNYRARHRNETNTQKRISNARNVAAQLRRRRRRQAQSRSLRDRFSLLAADLLLVATVSPMDEKAAHRLTLELQQISAKIGPSRRRGRVLADRIALMRGRGLPAEDLALLDEARNALTPSARPVPGGTVSVERVLVPKGGRPAETERAARVTDLVDQGIEWPEIQSRIAEEFGVHTTVNALRKLRARHIRRQG